MNQEIVEKTNEVLAALQSSEILDETSLSKTVALCQIINFEMDRIEKGGEVDIEAAKTFARVFDKFSAIFLEQGINPVLCEAMNKVANATRRLIQDRTKDE